MPVFVVANPKGGVGKSTLSTQLAGYLANQGYAVMLGDLDRQQSSRLWLGLRPPEAAPIQTWAAWNDGVFKVPKGVSHVVVDTPAGLKGKKLASVLRLADRVIVPLQAGVFDMQATLDFLAELAEHKHGHLAQVGLVGMRVDARTLAAERLRAFVDASGFAAYAYLRSTQVYVHLAHQGLTLFDLPPAQAARDVAQWQDLIQWVNAAGR